MLEASTRPFARGIRLMPWRPANSGVGSRPGDPLALLVRGLAERANSDRKKAAEDYRKAFEMTKDSPEQQIFLAGQLIATKDPLDVAEAEALRDLLPDDARRPAAGNVLGAARRS